MKVRNLTTGILGLILLSPLNLTVLGVLPQQNAWPLTLVFLMDGIGILMAVRGLGSPGVAIVLACVANVPLLGRSGFPRLGNGRDCSHCRSSRCSWRSAGGPGGEGEARVNAYDGWVRPCPRSAGCISSSRRFSVPRSGADLSGQGCLRKGVARTVGGDPR